MRRLRVGDASQVEEECRHLQHDKLKEQKLQEPLAEDRNMSKQTQTSSFDLTDVLRI